MEDDAMCERLIRNEEQNELKADCQNCFGLCCVALHFSKAEGFPENKIAGHPCMNLQKDFRCSTHKNLIERGLKGCVAYDCFGAGQKTSKTTFGGLDWQQKTELAKPMFEAFLIQRQLHELLWYLTLSLTLKAAVSIHSKLKESLDETERLTNLGPEDLLKLDMPSYRAEVNKLLIKTSELFRAEAQSRIKATAGEQKVLEQQKKSAQHKALGRRKTLGIGADFIGVDLRNTDLRGVSLRGAYLISSDLSGLELFGVDLIGADLRDANFSASDLSGSIFLTQGQINAAKGDGSTILPASLSRPEHWPKFNQRQKRR